MGDDMGVTILGESPCYRDHLQSMVRYIFVASAARIMLFLNHVLDDLVGITHATL